MGLGGGEVRGEGFEEGHGGGVVPSAEFDVDFEEVDGKGEVVVEAWVGAKLGEDMVCCYEVVSGRDVSFSGRFGLILGVSLTCGCIGVASILPSAPSIVVDI